MVYQTRHWEGKTSSDKSSQILYKIRVENSSECDTFFYIFSMKKHDTEIWPTENWQLNMADVMPKGYDVLAPNLRLRNTG
jgi:hypothetical protein